MVTDQNVNTDNILRQDTLDSDWLVNTISYSQLGGDAVLPCQLQSCAVILNERERIGMDLHDGIIQSLYALGMHVDLLARSDRVDAMLLTPITDGLNQVIDEIRLYIRNLQQSKQGQQNIRQCFEEILERQHAWELIEVHLDVPEQMPPFTPLVFDNICLMVQEIISNVIRHAEATHLRISMFQVDQSVRVLIADNGIGFKVDTLEDKGMGLHNLQKRAQFFGGVTKIDSAPGRGTRVTIDLSY